MRYAIIPFFLFVAGCQPEIKASKPDEDGCSHVTVKRLGQTILDTYHCKGDDPIKMTFGGKETNIKPNQ
jgi:hypothetical protein